MSDWTGESIVDGFPRVNTTYWIQFITEPEIITKEAQGGRKYKQASVRLQFFMPDEFGEYHYAGWGEKNLQPCVLEYLTEFGPDILTRLICVKGVEHKKHVDLELVDSWDKINASDTITKTTPPTPPAVASIASKYSTPDEVEATAEPCSHTGIVKMLRKEDLLPEQEPGFWCEDCGERVG